MQSFLWILNAVLISRLCFFESEKLLSWRRAVVKSVIELAVVFGLFRTCWSLLFAAIGLLLANAAVAVIEMRSKKAAIALRSATFVAIVVVLAFCFASTHGVQFWAWTSGAVGNLARHVVILGDISATHWLQALLVLAGLLACLTEVNMAVRLVIGKLSEKHSDPEEGMLLVSAKQIRRGRVIGMLERVIVYFFVLNGAYAGVAFVIAAKGFARFRDLDDRDFAEYVLIGTLASIVFAGMVAFGVKSALSLIQ